jgi:multimeric flavodoxin WrbA
MQEVLRLLVASDVLVLATPVRFGSYCAQLKKVIDRFQPLMMPIYVVRSGEMHFRGRISPAGPPPGRA